MRGNQRNFNGVTMRVSGGDIALNSFLDDLDFITGVEVLSRTDITACAGELALQLSAHARSKVTEIAGKHGLTAVR